MFVLVESGSVTKFLANNRGIQIGDLKYPAAIFTLWSESERNAIGVYEVEIDKTNFKDTEYYTNTDMTYTYDSSADKVKGTYGTATAKELADKTVDGVVHKGLKTIKKELIDSQCASILAPSDWRVVKEQETGDDMDSGWKTWRGNVRTKCNSMQTQINNAANVDALAALYTYNTDNPPTRPLGEFPVKE